MESIGLNYSRCFQVNRFSINHRARLGDTRYQAPAGPPVTTGSVRAASGSTNKIQGRNNCGNETHPAHKVGYVVYWVNGMSGPG